MKTILLFFFSFLLPITFLFSQRKIQGKITSATNQEVLIGANIIIKGTEKGTITDLKGRFSITLSPTDSVLEISYTGFQTQEINISQQDFYKIKLEEGDATFCPIIVAAAPLQITLPAPLMELRQLELERDNDLSIAPALNRVAGVYMHSGALNTNRITIRGIGNRSLFTTTKIRAYLDEIPLTTGDGETTLEDIDLSILKKVNVWKGPTASIYGAGLGGMIHLQTKNMYDDGEENSIASKTTFGSYGLLRNATTLLLENKKHRVNLALNVNRTHSDGYRENNEYDRTGFTLLGKWQQNKKNVSTLLFNSTSVQSFIPSSLNRTDFEENPRQAAFSWAQVKGFEDYEKILVGLSHQTILAQRKKFYFKNKSSVFFTYRDAYESRPFNILKENNWAGGLRTSFELDRAGLESDRLFPLLSVGIEAFVEDYLAEILETNSGVAGRELSAPYEYRTYFNLFAQTYLNLTDELTLLAGVNLNQTNYDYDDFAQDSIQIEGYTFFDPILSPKLGLSYQFNYEQAIFATLSHGFSPPSVAETLTPDGDINPNIQPERGWNFEAGSRGRFKNRFTYELTFFQMRVKDLLVAERIGPDQFVGINAGETRHNGMEIFMDVQLLELPQKLSTSLSYSYNDFKFIDFVNEDEDFSGNALTGAPPHQLNIALDYEQRNGWYGNADFQYVDAFPMRDDNSIYSDAYGLMNMKVGYKKSIQQKWEVDFFAGIRNVWNEKYASMILINAGSFGGNAPRYFYPGLPRNYFGGVRLKYKW